MLDVRLFPGLPGRAWARLDSITGAVEQSIEPGDPAGFAVLVNQLLVECDGTSVEPGQALDLAVADYDRIAARIYGQEYGNRVESRLLCQQCNQLFDVSFNLSASSPSVNQIAAEGIEGPDEMGAFQLRGGLRFRLPTLQDQLAIRGLNISGARHELLRRCLGTEPGSEQEMDAVEHAMEAVAPLVSGPISVCCPHCNFVEDDVQFSIQQYLLDCLAHEKRFLHYEVHYLARAYGWSREEILAMATTDRRLCVRMILAEAASR